MKKLSLTLLLVFTLIISAGCEYVNPLSPTAGMNPEQESQNNSYGNTDEAVIEDRVFENINEEFVPLQDTIVDTIVGKTSSYQGREFSVKTVLYKEDEVDVSIKYSEYKAFLTVDGKTIEVTAESPVSAHVVDLAEDDDFYEIAIQDEGPSCDPTISFFRYDGSRIIPITCTYEGGYVSEGVYGWIEGEPTDVEPTYGTVWTNRKGRIINSMQNIGFVNKRIAVSCYDISGSEWVESRLDIYNCLDKEFEISENIDVFYTPSANKPRNYTDTAYTNNFDFEKMVTFEKGEKIKILDIGEFYSHYGLFVEYKGEKAVVVFWIGD